MLGDRGGDMVVLVLVVVVVVVDTGIVQLLAGIQIVW